MAFLDDFLVFLDSGCVVGVAEAVLLDGAGDFFLDFGLLVEEAEGAFGREFQVAFGSSVFGDWSMACMFGESEFEN